MMQSVVEEIKKEGLLKEESDTGIEAIRQYIVDAAHSLHDEKLLKMLYIRAKSLKNMQ